MKFTLGWLKEHLETSKSADEIAASLNQLGLEVESLTDRSKEFAPFIVAEILEAIPHPQADKLRLCKVNTGKEILQIVCGAANARAGIKVVLAPIGTIIPANQMVIKAAEIRGVKSNGMLCSAAELCLGVDGEGIIELSADAAVGAPFASEFGLDDPVFEIAVTPNRADCLGVRGIARDLAAKGVGKFIDAPILPLTGSFDSPISVSIEDVKKAPYFLGVYIKGVKNTQSPKWLKNRLQAVGQTPISALVDITNYLSLTFARPAHIYDADLLKGGLTVRSAKDGEKIAALNHKEYALDASMTVIADDSRVVALGGIIGDETSACSEKTTNAFLEIALFEPISVALAGRTLQIDSDARHRFERGVDPLSWKQAGVALKLIKELCGGESSKPVIAGSLPDNSYPTNVEVPTNIFASYGISATPEQVKSSLEKLGFKIEEQKNHYTIAVPSFRGDITIAQDIVEEVARIIGYEHIAAVPLPATQENASPVLSGNMKREFDAKRMLAARGVMEVVSFSFVSSKEASQFTTAPLVTLANPISSDLDAMRPTVVASLLKAVQKNAARMRSDLALFEIGPVFEGTATAPKESRAIGIVRSGAALQKNHYGTGRNVDVFDAKADLFSVVSLVTNPEKLSVSRNAPPYYHPGKSGVLMLGKNVIGYFGELHPSILKEFDITVPVVASELLLSNLPEAKRSSKAARAALQVSDFPIVTRDFAFVVSDDVAAGDVLNAIRKLKPALIKDAKLFDVYQGKGVIDGKKSLALTVWLEPMDRTLTDAEIEEISSDIVHEISKSFSGELRA